jgi:hypothetical protein
VSPSRQILVWSQGELSGDDTVLKLLADKAKFETSQWRKLYLLRYQTSGNRSYEAMFAILIQSGRHRCLLSLSSH